MPHVVDHLAELTGFRDRDVLDTTLVAVLRDLLQPLSVTVCHTVGDEAQQRWLVRARLAEGDVAASSDSLWAELDGLPKLRASRRAWSACDAGAGGDAGRHGTPPASRC